MNHHLKTTAETRVLLHVSRFIDYEKLEDFGASLELNANQIYCAKYSAEGYLPRECFNLLIKWKQINGRKATYERLLHVLTLCKNKGHSIDVENIQECIQNSFK